MGANIKCCGRRREVSFYVCFIFKIPTLEKVLRSVYSGLRLGISGLDQIPSKVLRSGLAPLTLSKEHVSPFKVS